jgi:hypothetical protein
MCSENVFLVRITIDEIVVCTDGAQSTAGIYSIFKALIKKVALHAKFNNCVLHRHTFGVNTFPLNVSEGCSVQPL